MLPWWAADPVWPSWRGDENLAQAGNWAKILRTRGHKPSRHADRIICASLILWFYLIITVSIRITQSIEAKSNL